MPTPARTTSRYGWIPDLPDHRDRLYNLEEQVYTAVQLPPKVDLRSKMPPIYDQGQLGSCTGNGVARVMEAIDIKQGDKPETPSRLFIYYEERRIEGTIGEDAGAQIRDGIKVVANTGVPPESDWPYDVSKFRVKPPAKAYTDALKFKAIEYKKIVLGQPGAPIRTAISQGNPVVFGFTVFDRFEDPDWDPTNEALSLPGQYESPLGGHCVTITGYDYTKTKFPVNVIQCDNSWGKGWGDGGRFYFDAAWFDPHAGLVSDLWVVTRVS